MYKGPEVIAEFSIYDDKYKEDILRIHKRKSVLPFYISWILILLKIIYYDFQLIDKDWYKYLKTQCLNSLLGMKSEEFLTFDY
jgi:hypothetical protein